METGCACALDLCALAHPSSTHLFRFFCAPPHIIRTYVRKLLQGVTAMEAEGEEFGQRRPPLSHIIKRILERYPDGQVFKANS